MVGALLLSAMVNATELNITFEVPKLTVAEYHTPYAAVWLKSAEERDKKPLKSYPFGMQTKRKKRRVKIQWKKIGMYWLGADYQDNKATKPATVRSGSYSATLEVLAE